MTTVDDHLDELERLSKPDPLPVLKAAGGILRADEIERFETDTDPQGVPWPELAPATIRRKGHATILEETGALLAAATQRDAPGHVETIDGDTLTFGVDGVTQLGGIPWAEAQQGGTPRIPAREFIGASEHALDQIMQAAGDHELERWKD